MSGHEQWRQACEAWLNAALSVLTGQPIVVAPDMQVTLTENGYSTRTEYRPDYGMIVARARLTIQALPESRAIVELVRDSEVMQAALCLDGGGNIVTEPEQQTYFIFTYLDRFLWEYLRVTDDLTPPMNVPAFQQVYAQLEQYIFAEEPFPALWTYYVRNLHPPANPIQLDQNVVLRQPTDDERKQAIKEAIGHPAVRFGFAEAPTAFIEVQSAKERATIVDAVGPLNIPRSVLLGLRLLKPNPVGLSGSRWNLVNQPFPLNGGFSAGPLVSWDALRGERYDLTDAEAEKLAAMWRKVKRAMEDNTLSIAITRLEDSYVRTKDTDKLIDYWTALESLFLPEDEQVRDMGETVAMVVAHYIGRSIAERKGIREDIKRSHAVRSHLVHGKRREPKHDVAEMVEKTGQHLRRALRQRIME